MFSTHTRELLAINQLNLSTLPSTGIGSCGDEMSAAGGKDASNLGKRKVAGVVDAMPRVWMLWKQNNLGGDEAAEKTHDDKTHAGSGGDAARWCV